MFVATARDQIKHRTIRMRLMCVILRDGEEGGGGVDPVARRETMTMRFSFAFWNVISKVKLK